MNTSKLILPFNKSAVLLAFLFIAVGQEVHAAKDAKVCKIQEVHCELACPNGMYGSKRKYNECKSSCQDESETCQQEILDREEQEFLKRAEQKAAAEKKLGTMR